MYLMCQNVWPEQYVYTNLFVTSRQTLRARSHKVQLDKHHVYFLVHIQEIIRLNFKMIVLLVFLRVVDT